MNRPRNLPSGSGLGLVLLALAIGNAAAVAPPRALTQPEEKRLQEIHGELIDPEEQGVVKRVQPK